MLKKLYNLRYGPEPGLYGALTPYKIILYSRVLLK